MERGRGLHLLGVLVPPDRGVTLGLQKPLSDMPTPACRTHPARRGAGARRDRCTVCPPWAGGGCLGWGGGMSLKPKPCPGQDRAKKTREGATIPHPLLTIWIAEGPSGDPPASQFFSSPDLPARGSQNSKKKSGRELHTFIILMQEVNP